MCTLHRLRASCIDTDHLHLAEAFIQSDLQCYTFIVSIFYSQKIACEKAV